MVYCHYGMLGQLDSMRVIGLWIFLAVTPSLISFAYVKIVETLLFYHLWLYRKGKRCGQIAILVDQSSAKTYIRIIPLVGIQKTCRIYMNQLT